MPHHSPCLKYETGPEIELETLPPPACYAFSYFKMYTLTPLLFTYTDRSVIDTLKKKKKPTKEEARSWLSNPSIMTEALFFNRMFYQLLRVQHIIICSWGSVLPSIVETRDQNSWGCPLLFSNRNLRSFCA